VARGNNLAKSPLFMLGQRTYLYHILPPLRRCIARNTLLPH
jgi:hypothetical protein